MHFDPAGSSPLSLFDIGLNLTHDSFDHDREQMLRRAATAGVTHMLITGSDADNSRAAWQLAQQHPTQLRSTAGFHPHHAKDLLPEHLPVLRELLQQPEVLAVGECGLDYLRNFSSHEQQETAFRQQLELAVECGKPVFLHERDAHDPFVAILRDYLPQIRGGVAHCFTGNTQQVERYLSLGLHIGVTGWICDERRGGDLREAVKHIPLERLLIETDAPYLIPRTLRPKPKSHRNEAMHLVAVLAEVAHCRGEPPEQVAAATLQNALRLFNWPA